MCFGYDAAQIIYVGFDPGNALPNAHAVAQQDSTSIRIGVSSLSGSATVNTGLVGTVHFRTTAVFSDTEIWLVDAELARGEQSETISPALSVALQVAAPSSPDFDGNGLVGFSDFVAFAGVFGAQRGDGKYVAEFDLNNDGGIGFDDFVIFARSFGEAVNRAPVFTATPPVTRSVEENTPSGQPIGDPVTATDADADSLTYRLRGAHADSFAIDAATGQSLTKEGILYDHEARDTYSVTVRASDGQGGRATVVVGITVADVDEPPSAAPEGVLVAPRDTALTVFWRAASNEPGKPPVSGFEVAHRAAEAEAWLEGLLLESRTDTSITIAGLTNQQTYHVRVRTLNDEGESPWSEPVAGAPTVGPRPLGVIGDLTVYVDRDLPVNLASLFTRPALGSLTYGATSSDDAIAAVTVADTMATVWGVATGRATITATAGNTYGNSAQTTFAVVVTTPPPPPPPPGPVGPVGPIGPFRPPPPPPPPPNNRAPTFDDGSSTSRTVPENTPARQPIQHPVRATDPDGHRVTYNLSGPDSASFSVDTGTGQLRTLSGITYDFEDNDRYSVDLEVDDPDGGTATIGVTIHVADVDEPPSIPAAPLVQPASTTSLTVTWDAPSNTGPDINDYDVQYRTGSGNFDPWPHDNTGTTTTITNLEVNKRYEVQVRAHNDEGESRWSPSGFGTTRSNLPPVFDEGRSATRSLGENTPSDRNVGSPVTATDPENTTLTYRLARADTDQFTIDPNNGQLRTQTGADYNYEVKNRYSVTVEAQDEQGGRATITVTIDVINDDSEAPEAPGKPTISAQTLNSLSIRWTAPVNAGPAVNDYDVQYSEDGGAFTGWPHTGPATTATITGLNANTPYQVQVLARSPEGESPWSESADARTVANRTPTFNEGTITTRSFAENTTGTNHIGNPLTARDTDGGTLSYGLEGEDRASFALDGAQLQTITGETYDFEEKSRYEVIVRVEDGQGGSSTIEVTINLTDQQEKPGIPDAPGVSAASSTSLTATWDEPANTGPDASDYDVQYREGDSGGFSSWTHNGADRTATITGRTPGTSYQVQVRAHSAEGTSDWSESGTGSTDANQLPVLAAAFRATISLPENTSGVKDVGDPVSATDPENTALTYRLEGTDADAFTIDARRGQLRTSRDETYDYETKSRYRVIVKATDEHQGSLDIPVFINLTDVNEPPSFTSDAAFEAAENQTFAGRVAAEDVDSGDNIATYTPTGGVDQALFEVNSGGVLTFKDAPDFEKPADAGRNNQYNVAVTATGGTGGRALTAEQAITVTVTDENEAPVFTSDDAFKVDENEQLVGRVTATDVDRDDGITGYEVTGGADENRFEIASTNQLRFKDDPPDFERPADSGGNNEYLVEVTATGGTGTRVMTGTQTVTVVVEDKNEAPGKPEPPAASDETESSLTVSWTEPANTGPVITNYHVQYRDSGAFTSSPDSGLTRTRTISSLSSGRTYQFQVQARNDEGKGPWSDPGSGTTLIAPTVSSVAFTSTPASAQNNTYKLNDVMSVTATFSEAVTVTNTPQMDLTIGSTVRQANYQSGSTTTLLEFQYTVADTDEDTDGASVNENGLKLNGGSIRKTSTALNADLAHAALASQSGHKVDGIAPALTKAEVDGDELTLTYGEALDNDPLPATGDIAVTVDSEARSVTTVAVSGREVTLTLASTVTMGQTVVMSYTPGTHPIRDQAQNPASALSNLAVANLKNVCNRTAEVRDAIMDAARVSACGDVTADHLSAITRLSLYDENIPTLKADDFSGLTNLEKLYLEKNNLSSLPADIFSDLSALEVLSLKQNNLSALGANTFSGLTALSSLDLSFSHLGSFDADLFSGLTALTHLQLRSARINSLPANGFSVLTALDTLILQSNLLGDLDADAFSGLSTLEHLDLEYARITSLPATVFSPLSGLEHLNLRRNELGSLDAGLFSGLTALTHLDLVSMDLTSVPGNLFSGLTELEFLDLSYNLDLTTLPATVFSGLTELRSLDLRQMYLSTLPDGVFSGLTELTRLWLQWNTVDPLPITVSLESAGTDQFRAKVHTGAPFDMILPLEVVNGVIDGGASSIVISQGDVESSTLTVTRPTGTSAAVTVDIGTLPDRPGTDNGYALVKSDDLPLEVISGLPEVDIYPTALSVAAGDSSSYTMTLNSMPTMDVTVTVDAPSGSDVSVNPMERMFAADTYDMSQAVTVIADTGATANDVVTLSHMVSGGDYQNVSADDVSVTIISAITGNQSPSFTSDSSYDVKENETAVATVVATDGDAQDYITGYEITGGAQQTQFAVTREGVLTLVTAPDYERPAVSSNRYAVTVTATSGIGNRKRTASQTIIVTVTDEDEPPGQPAAPTLDLPFAPRTILLVSHGRRRTANTGPDITGWGIRYREGNSGDFITHTSHPSPKLSVQIKNLNRGVTYEVQVQAKNDEGDSEWSPSAEITILNQSPVAVGSFDDLTLAVGSAVEIVSADGVFKDLDRDILTYAAKSSDTAAASVQVIGTEILVDHGSAGSATITVTASDPYGASDSETFDVTVQTPTLAGPTLTISGNLFTLAFTDAFAADETRAYQVRIRQKTNHGPWATGCHTETNDEASPQSISVTLQDAVSEFFEPGTTYEADYGYLGTACNGSLTGSRSATAEMTTSGSPSFDIDLVFVGSISSTYRSAVEAAAERWERIITGDVPNHRLSTENRNTLNEHFRGTTAPEVVDDLVIYVRSVDLDGPLGQVWTQVRRVPSALPTVSRISIDRDILGTYSVSILEGTVLHEMGHALGYSSGPWEIHNLLKNPSRDSFGRPIDPSPDTYFSGAKAVAAFDAAGGASYSGAKVPVENTLGPGSRDSHWRESVMQSELMTPNLGGTHPLSAITIQSLADLGYTVDVTRADAYTLPSTSKIAIGSEGLILRNCVIEHPEAGPDIPEPVILNLRKVSELE